MISEKTDHAANIQCALADTLLSSARAYPLRILARPKYVFRELRPHTQPDGTIQITVAKWGWEYKHRGARPKLIPAADTDGIKSALAAAIPEHTICSVIDKGTRISVIFQG